MLGYPPPGRSGALPATRHARRRGIVVNGLAYQSPALEAALSSAPTAPVRILVDPADLQAISVVLQPSTELTVPVVPLTRSLRRSCAAAPQQGPRMLALPASATRGAVTRGRLSPQVEKAILEVCLDAFGSFRPRKPRAAYEMLSARLGAMGLKRPSYSTFLRRARRWPSSGS